MEGQFIQNSEMEGQIIHAQMNRPVEFIHSDNVNTVKTELKHTNKITELPNISHILLSELTALAC